MNAKIRKEPRKYIINNISKSETNNWNCKDQI